MIETPTTKLNIGIKLATIAILSLVGMSIILFLFYQGLVSSLIQEKELHSKILSNAGLSIIKHFNSTISQEGVTKHEAQETAKKVLKSMRFGKNGYFWLNDSKGFLMHPYTNKSAVSKLFESAGIDKNDIYHQFEQTAKQGGGLVEYYWPKPGSTIPGQKFSYVEYFEPWDWILGTGLYLDDIHKQIKHYTFSAFSLVLIFAIFLFIFTISLTNKLMFQLEKMAIHDPLTKLYTRHYLNEYMNTLMLRHERKKDSYLSVIFFDIDFFKKINDTYGHACGDHVLAKIGEIIRNISRPDDICVRYGGEELIVISLSKHQTTTLRMAKRIIAKVKEMIFNHNNVEFSVTLSAGMAIRKDNELFSTTLQRADKKLYMAKAKGRNCLVG